MVKDSITLNQCKSLFKLGYKNGKGFGYFHLIQDSKGRVTDWISVPTCDQVIDWLRANHNVIIYNAVEPVVDPKNSGKILYRFAIKWCNKRDGWNGRIYIGTTRFAANIYSLKREAITKALQWLKRKQTKTKQCQ